MPPLTAPSRGAPPPPATGNAQLDALMSKPGTAKLVEKFLARLNERIDAIRAAAEAADANQLKTLAHQLKGAAGGYGFPNISDAAKAVEQVALNGELERINEAVRRLADLCAQATKHAPNSSPSTTPSAA